MRNTVVAGALVALAGAVLLVQQITTPLPSPALVLVGVLLVVFGGMTLVDAEAS